MGDSPCPCSYGKKLLILDVNGLLLAFSPTDMKKEYDTGEAQRLNMDLYFYVQ